MHERNRIPNVQTHPPNLFETCPNPFSTKKNGGQSTCKQRQQQPKQSLRLMGTFRFNAWSICIGKDIPPTISGGGCSKSYQVTSKTQLSWPTLLGHYTSLNADCKGGHTWQDGAPTGQLSWKHFGIDAYSPWVPRSWCRRSANPRAHDTIDDDQTMQWSDELMIPRCHAVIVWYYDLENAILLASEHHLWKYS